MSDRRLAVLERAHRADPGEPSLALELACHYARVGRVRAAFRVCEAAALELPPEVAESFGRSQRSALARLGGPDAQVATRAAPEGGWAWRDLLSFLERPSEGPALALNLPWRRLGVRDLEALASLLTLRELRLTGWDEGTGVALRRLEPLRSLRVLALDYSPLVDPDLVRLQAFPALARLDLAHCGRLAALRLEPLAELPSLRALDLSYTATGGAGLEAFRGHATLEELRLQDCQAIDEGALEVLSTCPALRLLDLGFCQGIRRASLEDLRSVSPGLKVLW